MSDIRQAPETSDAPATRRRRGPIKLILFALAPTVLIVVAFEVGLRIWGLADPTVQSLPLPGEYEGIYRPDEELFWSMRPSLSSTFEDVTVRTNRLGLRSDEIGAKQTDELRILSLGESTTFGARVQNEETYTELLGRLLREKAGSRSITSINAGVSAYSSFQSLIYLMLRGIDLEPDLVLFYHEINDYFPSSLRDSSNNEVGLSRTDRQLFESQRGRVDRKLLRYSAIWRFLTLRMAKMRIEKLQQDTVDNPLMSIGLPDIGLPPRVIETDSEIDALAGINEKALPSRVSPAERRQNFDELLAFCREHEIRLLVIHPSYVASTPHECLLTEFCEREGVPMLDAYDALHPEGSPQQEFFLDSMHPTPEGHRRLAEALAEKIIAENLHAGR